MKVKLDELGSEMPEEGDEIRTYSGVPFTGTTYLEIGGQLVLQREYRNGLPNGLERRWYTDGTMKSESNLIDGGAHGEVSEWHPNGILKRFARCEYGITLEANVWDENGNLTRAYKLELDSGLYKELLRRRAYYSSRSEGK